MSTTSSMQASFLFNPVFFNTILIGVSFLVLMVLLKRALYARTSRRNLPPSPPKLPIIGNLHQLGSLPHHSLRPLAKSHGPIAMIHLANVPVLVVSSARAAREIMKTHDLVFANRPKSKNIQTLLYNYKDVSMAPYGEYWRQIKSICVLHLLSNKRVQSFGALREDKTDLMVQKIAELSGSSSLVKQNSNMAMHQWLKLKEGLQFHPSMLFFTSIFLLVLLKFLFKEKFGNRKLNLPPSPPKLPIIGNLHQLSNMPHLSLSRLADKFGPILYLQLAEVPTVVVSSPRLAKEVMKTHDLALASRPQIFSAKHLFYDCTDMVFTPYGAYWRHVRKICTLELLSVKRVQSFGFIREEEVARMADRVAECYPATTNLSKILGLYANDVLCRAAFRRNFSAGGEYDRHGFQKMLEEYQELLGGLSIGDFFPSMEFVHSLTGMKSRLQHTFQRFDQFFDEIIKEHLNPDRAKEELKDLVDVLLDMHKNGSMEIPLTIDNIKAIILDMFAAGTDTTFITLDWGMTELMMNPRVMEKAQAEVRSIVGQKKVVAESDLPQMQYMKAVIKEIFRLHPPAPVLVPREAMEDVIIDGYDIPAKTRIFVNAWAIGRDPESWLNPETFEPERFLDSSIDFKGQDYELIPFGAGRRMCPALSFGTASVELALAQLLHRFDWELPPGTQAQDLDLNEVFGITMHRKANLIVVAKPHFP